MSERIYCFFSPQFLPHMGGVERYTYNLAKNLAERGLKVLVITSLVDKLPAKEKMDGFTVCRVPCMNLMNGRYPVVKFWSREYRALMKSLKSRRKKLFFIINTRFYVQSYFAARFAARNGISQIIIDHGTSHLSLHNVILDKGGNWWEHFLTLAEKRYCKNYYAVSHASCDWLKHFGITARGVLYNALSLNEMEQLRESRDSSFRQRYHIPNDACLIVFTGRLLEEKGIKQLVSSVERICQNREDVYLVLAGDGPLEEYVSKHASEHIIPTGRLKYQDIVSLLCVSDIFCMPSVSEGFSTSVLEAAFCRCYIITTFRGGSKELVVSDEYGSIISNDSEELVYHALLKAISNPDARAEACEKCYNKMIREFTWDNTTEKLIGIVELKEQEAVDL